MPSEAEDNVFDRLYKHTTVATRAGQREKYQPPEEDGERWHNPSKDGLDTSFNSYDGSPSKAIPTLKKKVMVKTPKKMSSKEAKTAAVETKKAIEEYKPIDEIELPSKEKLFEIFDYVDVNGNGMLSLAEIDKAVVEAYPHFNSKPVLLRAYKAADKNNDGFIRKNEFLVLCCYIKYYNNCWNIFQSIDADGDRRLSLEEFVAAAPQMGVADPEQAFAYIDTNMGGYVLFDEFCEFMSKRASLQLLENEEEIPESTPEDQQNEQTEEAALLSSSTNEQTESPTQVNTGEEERETKLLGKAEGSNDDKTECVEDPQEKMKQHEEEPAEVQHIEIPNENRINEIWNTVDYNNNGILSLAEIDKAIVETWPSYNHKPVIMRAYKAADINGDGFIKRNEFTFLLKYVKYYTECYRIFQSIDIGSEGSDGAGDRRIDKIEFINACNNDDAPLKAIIGNDKDPEELFSQIDTNNGGYILFDEFCQFCARMAN